MTTTYTPALLREFDRLTMNLCSRNQMTRIDARLKIFKMKEDYGEDVCAAMFEVLKKRDAKRKPK